MDAPSLRPVAILGAALTLTACASARIVEAPLVAAPVVASPKPVGGAPPAECQYESTTRREGRFLPRFVPKSRPYARVDGAVVERLIASPHTPGAAHVTLRVPHARLEGHDDAVRYPLYPARPLTLGEALIPFASTMLHWRAARAGSLSVTLAAPLEEGVDVASPSAAVPCGGLSLDAHAFEARDAVPGLGRGVRGADPGRVLLRANRTVNLTETPGGAQTATLKVDAEAREVEVLRVEGAHTRVLVELTVGLLVGWVARADTEPLPPDAIGDALDLVGGLGLSGVGEGRGRREAAVRCDAAVALWAAVDGDAHQVGEIDPATSIDLDRTMGDRWPVSVPGWGVTPAPGATLFVRRGDVASCARDSGN